MSAFDNYWGYYDLEAGCPCGFVETQYFKHSVVRFHDIGCSSDDVSNLISSGFLAVDDYLIDRFYGGLLASLDGRTRYPIDEDTVNNLLCGKEPNLPHFPVLSASSPAEVRSIVSRIEWNLQCQVVFRGQVNHYTLTRPIPNPAFRHPILRETSLLPSVWRPVLQKHPTCLVDFVPLGVFDWSEILYNCFDIDEVDAAIISSGDNPALLTISDMAEHPNPMVRRFGEFRRELIHEHNHGLATQLSTLLQHYGLLSNVLDVTREIDTAIFFATHRYKRVSGRSTYIPVGSNNGRAIIYILKFAPTEMKSASHDQVLTVISPLRPERQACVVVGSSPFAVNLPADFLVGAVRLEGSGPWELSTSVHHYFPNDRDDRFLRALKSHRFASLHLTDFW